MVKTGVAGLLEELLLDVGRLLIDLSQSLLADDANVPLEGRMVSRRSPFGSQTKGDGAKKAGVECGVGAGKSLHRPRREEHPP